MFSAILLYSDIVMQINYYYYYYYIWGVVWGQMSGMCLGGMTREKCSDLCAGLQVSTCSNYDLCHHG